MLSRAWHGLDVNPPRVVIFPRLLRVSWVVSLFTRRNRYGWSTVVVNGTRQIPNRNFHGDALVPLPRIFPGRLDQRRSKPKGLELVKLENGTHIFHSKIPFGNFGLPFKKSSFPKKISVRGDKINFPFTFHPKFPDFLGKW